MRAPEWVISFVLRRRTFLFKSFDIPHGTNKTFDAFKAVPTDAKGLATPGVSTALDPRVANEFAERAARDSARTSPQVYPLFHRADNPAPFDLTGNETRHQVVETLRDAFDRGHDAVMLRNYTSPGGLTGQKIIIVRDANQLRSPNAAFDPAKRNSANQLASLLGASALAPIASAPSDSNFLSIPAPKPPVF